MNSIETNLHPRALVLQVATEIYEYYIESFWETAHLSLPLIKPAFFPK